VTSSINSSALTVGALFTSAQFQPAPPQRRYCWTELEQERLFDHIEKAFLKHKSRTTPPDPDDEAAAVAVHEDEEDDAFFLGSCILHNSEGRCEIYDGLQRFATLTVLLSVLRDRLERQGREFGSEVLQSPSGEWRLTLATKHGVLEREILAPGKSLIAHRLDVEASTDDRCLRQAVALFRSRVESWDLDKLAAFASFLRDRVVLSAITMNSESMASSAFVSVNKFGVPLEPADLVKGYLVDLARGLPDPAKAADEMLQAWTALQARLGPFFSSFLKAVDFLHRQKIQREGFEFHLLDFIRKQRAGKDAYNWVVHELSSFAGAYERIVRHFGQKEATGIDASFRRLWILDWDEWQAAALQLIMKSNDKDLKARMDAFDKLCFFFTLAHENTANRAKVFVHAIRRFGRGAFGDALGFRIDESHRLRFKNEFQRPQEDIRQKVLVAWTEAFLHGGKVPAYLVRRRTEKEPRAATLEHVYPRNPGDNWRAFELGRTTDELDTLCNQIGNLCFLTQDTLANAPFSLKRREYGRQKDGILFAKEIASNKDWLPDDVRKRTKSLLERVLKQLPFAN
jgi:hypothetical protein